MFCSHVSLLEGKNDDERNPAPVDGRHIEVCYNEGARM